MYGTQKKNKKLSPPPADNKRVFLASALTAALLSVLITLSGCASTGGNNGDRELDLAKFATVTTHTAVNNVESTYQSSDVNELSVYAPSHYSTAGKAIEDAKALLAQSQPREKVIQKIAVAEAILKDGDRVMRKVKDILKPEISIKEKLDALNAKSTYSNEYGSLNERFNKLILAIESGNTKESVNREKLLKDMQKLGQKSLRYNAMNEPREILKRVKYRGGEQLAPITYGEALAVFKRAEEFIAQNPDYDLGITQVGREALFAAKRALYITEGVAALKQRFEFAPEQILLDEEYRMYRVARQLGELDYRDNSLEVQSELLAKQANAIAQELDNKEGLVIALRDTLIKVRDSSSQLTALSDATEKLKSEKNQWIAKEALFKAKVAQLEEQLEKSQAQLDFTQQKLLAFKADNTRLISETENNAKQAKLLKEKLAQLEHERQHEQLLRQQLTAQQPPGKEKNQPANLKNDKEHNDNNELNPKLLEEPLNKSQRETVKTTASAKPEMPFSKTDTQPFNSATSNESSAVRDTAQQGSNKSTRIVQVQKSQAEKTAISPEQQSIQESKFTDNIEEIAQEKKPSQKARPKITEQETLEAILSAKELIKSLKSEETQLAQKQTPKSTPEEVFDNTNDIFSDDEDGFVDASE